MSFGMNQRRRGRGSEMNPVIRAQVSGRRSGTCV
jgi:hypothetical protein